MRCAVACALVVPAVLAGAATSANRSGDGVQGVLVDPTRFVRAIDNPWFPLKPGTTFVYVGVEGGEPTRDVVTVTRRTKAILGVRCVVIRDNVYIAGRLEERTTDWYAQDRAGNVWYFGEATAELDRRGRVKTREGSWEAGVDGAQPGIFMPARPRVGQAFRQEYYEGHAEDHFRIVSLSARVKVPHVSSRRAMATVEWTPLEPGVRDSKYYVRGVGLVKDERIGGGSDRLVLTAVKKG
jgi:hypothetical protein